MRVNCAAPADLGTSLCVTKSRVKNFAGKSEGTGRETPAIVELSHKFRVVKTSVKTSSELINLHCTAILYMCIADCFAGFRAPHQDIPFVFLFVAHPRLGSTCRPEEHGQCCAVSGTVAMFV